jgi:N-acetyl-anhydromuramyl-L-alanine amidase AmpD
MRWLLLLAGACAGAPERSLETTVRRGEEIVVCGRLFVCGTRVVLWSDPGGYDAYRETPFFADELADRAPILGARYGARRGLPHPPTLADVQRRVDQFVIHYDVCGTARQCFKVLHDHRKLSVHFLLDADGTVYQTLDLRERAWHATTANDRAVGVEIAHIGAYPHANHRMLVEWYRHDAAGPYVRFPAWMARTGLPAGFVARPARAQAVRGAIQGTELWQYDFTPQQYAALAKLTATLCRVLPELQPEVPRVAGGDVRPHVLPAAELAGWQGLLGHFHVQANKVDPGPAFDWPRLLAAVRAELTEAP